MKDTLMVLVLVISSVWAGGCGTICNLISEEPKMPLGGVQADIECIMSPKKDSPGSSTSSGKGPAILLAFVCADMTLSAVGDTLTFPLALYLIKVKGYPPPAPEEAANPPPSGGKVFSSAIVEE